MARPLKFPDNTLVGLKTGKKTSRLNSDSERRAIVNAIMDHHGRMTLEALDKHFGFSVRATALALMNSGWIEVLDEDKNK